MVPRAVVFSQNPSVNLETNTQSLNNSGYQQYREELTSNAAGSKSQSPSSNQNSIQYQYTTVDDGSPRAEARFRNL